MVTETEWPSLSRGKTQANIGHCKGAKRAGTKESKFEGEDPEHSYWCVRYLH